MPGLYDQNDLDGNPIIGAWEGECENFYLATGFSGHGLMHAPATGRAIASIDRLFEAAGATALNSDQAVQRFWRDAHAGRVHAANDAERAYVMYGNHEFGLPIGDTMVALARSSNA